MLQHNKGRIVGSRANVMLKHNLRGWSDNRLLRPWGRFS